VSIAAIEIGDALVGVFCHWTVFRIEAASFFGAGTSIAKRFGVLVQCGTITSRRQTGGRAD
jgi:hypothetical protein